MKNPIKIVKDIFKINADPQVVAKGFALGSFIGMLPIPGFQVMLSLAMASLLKFNKTAACIAVFNTNIATGAFVFSFNYWLGKKLLGVEPSFVIGDRIDMQFAATIFRAGSDVFLSLVVGGILTGIIAAFIVYYILIRFLTRRTCAS